MNEKSAIRRGDSPANQIDSPRDSFEAPSSVEHAPSALKKFIGRSVLFGGLGAFCGATGPWTDRWGIIEWLCFWAIVEGGSALGTRNPHGWKNAAWTALKNFVGIVLFSVGILAYQWVCNWTSKAMNGGERSVWLAAAVGAVLGVIILPAVCSLIGRVRQNSRTSWDTAAKQ